MSLDACPMSLVASRLSQVVSRMSASHVPRRMSHVTNRIKQSKIQSKPKFCYSPHTLYLCEMCGRSSLTKNEKELETRFQANFYSEDLERYNPLPITTWHLHRCCLWW